MTVRMEMICCNADKAVFYKHNDSKYLMVGVSTNDSMIAGTPNMIDWFKAEIAKHYKIKDLGEISYLLGFCIKWDQSAHTISINQSAYIKSITERFSINKKPTYIPMHAGTILLLLQSPSTPKEKESMNNICLPTLNLCSVC